MRIVSLLASGTEIVCALGLRASLVGRSHECDYPEDVIALPRCTDPAFSVDGSSAEIDRAVRAKARQALSLYSVDERRLAELAPDVIVTQTQCEVCAVSLKDVERALLAQLKVNARVVSLTGDDVPGVYADIQRVADVLGVPDKGRDLVTSMKAALAPTPVEAPPLVAVLEWLDPLMIAGHWLPELARAAGCRTLPPGWTTLDALIAADPDVIVAAPCGFHLHKTQPELEALAASDAWRKLRAVREGRLYCADGNRHFSRPGPRLPETAQILREIVHPELTRARFEDRAWRRIAARGARRP